MSTIQGTNVDDNSGLQILSWSGFTVSGDVGTPASVNEFGERTVQVFGTFGTSGAITFEGTNDPALGNWNTLNDPQGNAIVLTDTKIKKIQEAPWYIRPRLSAGSSTIALTVVVVSNSAR